MPTYSVQEEPSPWMPQTPNQNHNNDTRGSFAPTATASVYSEDYDGQVLDSPEMPSIAPLKISKPIPNPSYHAHPNHQVQDHGPQVRQSRLPIFKQVRSILQHKPSRLDTSGKQFDRIPPTNNVKRGKSKKAETPPRTNIYDGAFQVLRYPPRKNYRKVQPPRNPRTGSPVSVLRDEDIDQYSPPLGWDEDFDPISPISSDDEDDSHAGDTPRGLGVGSVNHLPETPHSSTPTLQFVKRKPAPGHRSLSTSENIPPEGSPISQQFMRERAHRDPLSHFSWTTAAPSINRPSTETRHSTQQAGDVLPASRFSWSTANTNMSHQARPVFPPPSPPPPVPSRYKSPPVQSILSRHRPIQRMDKDVWAPPPRKSVGTPDSAKSKLSIVARPPPDNAQGSAKKLPPPPELLTPVSPMSHLQELLTQEQDKTHQRHNIQRAIAELSKIETASPMDVSFAEMKEAKRKLEELRKTLAEVQLEEREIGIAIARTRRKEGGEEGLWVRRVTS